MCSKDLAVRARRFEEASKPTDILLNHPKLSPEGRAKALANRGVRFGQQGDAERAIADYTSVITMPEALVKQKTKAFCNRSWLYFEAGRITDSIADSRQAVAMAPQNVSALGNLAIALLVDQQTNDAITTYAAAIELADADHLATLEKELLDAIAKRGTIPGADEVQSRIESRAATLKTTAASQRETARNNVPTSSEAPPQTE